MGNTLAKLGAVAHWAGARLVMLSRLYLTLVAGWALASFLFDDVDNADRLCVSLA